jgi:uncharacterized protein (DUF983 family)
MSDPRGHRSDCPECGEYQLFDTRVDSHADYCCGWCQVACVEASDGELTQVSSPRSDRC